MGLSEQKREAILDAAEESFKIEGVSASSMDKIAQLAGVSKKTVYNHFPSKTALFQASLIRLLSQVHAVSPMVYDSKQALNEPLERLAIEETALITSDYFLSLARSLFREASLHPELTASIREQLPQCEETLEAWLSAAVNDKRLAITDIKFAAKQFIYSLKTFVLWPQLFGIAAPLTDAEKDKVITETIQLFLARYEV